MSTPLELGALTADDGIMDRVDILLALLALAGIVLVLTGSVELSSVLAPSG